MFVITVALQVVFVVLKLVDVIAWNWGVVWLPTMIYVGLSVVCYLLFSGNSMKGMNP